MIKNSQARLKFFTNICSSKKTDEFIGAPQPTYRLVGTKINMEFPKVKGEEVGETERKQVRRMLDLERSTFA